MSKSVVVSKSIISHRSSPELYKPRRECRVSDAVIAHDFDYIYTFYRLYDFEWNARFWQMMLVCWRFSACIPVVEAPHHSTKGATWQRVAGKPAWERPLRCAPSPCQCQGHRHCLFIAAASLPPWAHQIATSQLRRFLHRCQPRSLVLCRTLAQSRFLSLERLISPGAGLCQNFRACVSLPQKVL